MQRGVIATRVAAAAGLALAAIVAALALSGPGSAAAAVRGCDRPAGDPEQAAARQYCPRETPVKRAERSEAAPGAPLAGTDSGASQGKAAAAQKVSVEDSSVPLTGYPGSDGVNAIVWILLALLALLAARAIYRRYGGDRLRALGSRHRSGASG